MKSKLRIVSKFLWLPKRDNNRWYWLRKVQVVERSAAYKITEWPLIPWGFGGPYTYTEIEWSFVGIVDESAAIEIFIPDKDSPQP